MNYQQFKGLRNGSAANNGKTVSCHIGYGSATSFNCQLTPDQAKALAEQLKRQAKILVDNDVEGGSVHLRWLIKSPAKLWCGTHRKTGSPGRNKKRTVSKAVSD